MTVLSSSPHVLAAFWILDPIYTVMGSALAWFYALVPSYGLAIALLTIAVRILLIPLTTKQVKSQQAMQRIQPELKRLQAKYKDDRQKLNEEMMKFYKENKVNPVAGCLPLLLQTPLFLVLYRLILGLTHKPPKHIPVASELYTSLVASGGKMVSWGIDLAQSASAQKTFGDRWPYYILVALTVATGFYQQHQMTARMPAGASNAQMKMIGRVFPVMIGLISLNIPAGVVVYFIVSNVWQIAQQEVTFRMLGPVGAPEPPAKGGKDGGSGSAGSGSAGSGSGGSAGGGGLRGLLSGLGGGSTSGSGSGSRSRSGAGSGGKAGGSGRGRPSSSKRGSSKPPPKAPQPRQTGRQQPKSKRPPPSPRPKGLPGPAPRNGQQDPSAKDTRPRKDS